MENVFFADAESMTLIRPRDKIYEIKYVSHSGNLVIRTHGMDMIDIRPFHNVELMKWLTDELRQALGFAERIETATVVK